MRIIKFETLKKKAVEAFVCDPARGYCAGGGLAGNTSAGQAGVDALRYLSMDDAKRGELVAFADAFNAAAADDLAVAAKAHAPYALVALRDREDGIREIEKWDARNAGTLVKRYPNILPKHLRGRPFEVYMADNENSDWVLEFAEPVAA